MKKIKETSSKIKKALYNNNKCKINTQKFDPNGE